MNKKLYLLPFLIFALNAQESLPVPVIEPVITDLDLLVESVKTTASIRAKEDKARLNKFLSDKNKQQSFLIINIYQKDKCYLEIKQEIIKIAKNNLYI